jgi:2-methylcitrate dehydratase PrpD
VAVRGAMWMRGHAAPAVPLCSTPSRATRWSSTISSRMAAIIRAARRLRQPLLSPSISIQHSTTCTGRLSPVTKLVAVFLWPSSPATTHTGAMLLGGDRQGIANAIALSTSFAGGHQQNLQGEGMAKALHPGHAADAGLMAAMAAVAGVTASLDSLHAEDGFAAATSDTIGNWASALDGLGTWTPITRMTVKAHGCCGHIFPALDAISLMRAEHGFGPADIERIEVFGYRATQTMCNRPDPVSAQDARFSLQYCLAAHLHLGCVRLSAFEHDAMARPDIRALMTRISLSEDTSLSADYPRRRQARLRVYLRDGRMLEHLQKTRRGDPEDPLDDADLVAKFHELSSGIIAKHDAEGVVAAILYGDDLPGKLALTGPMAR